MELGSQLDGHRVYHFRYWEGTDEPRCQLPAVYTQKFKYMTKVKCNNTCQCFLYHYQPFTFICWFGVLKCKNRQKLLGVIKQRPYWSCQDSCHPLYVAVRMLLSGHKFLFHRCRTNILENSFIPAVFRSLCRILRLLLLSNVLYCYFIGFMSGVECFYV